MLFETCSGKRHFFNKMVTEYNHRANPDYPEPFPQWDRKCDCGKKWIAGATLEKFMKQFESKMRISRTYE